MCISFAKQRGFRSSLSLLRGLEPAPARCKSSSKLGSYFLTRSLDFVEPAPARCKSSSKLGSYLLTRSLNRSSLHVNRSFKLLQKIRSNRLAAPYYIVSSCLCKQRDKFFCCHALLLSACHVLECNGAVGHLLLAYDSNVRDAVAVGIAHLLLHLVAARE